MQDLQSNSNANKVLVINTFAFTLCFAAWMLNGVLVTFLASNQIFKWGPVEMAWLMAVPVLTGSIFRLPLGMLTDIVGGRYVHSGLLVFCSIPLFCLSYCDSFLSFVLCSFGFGMAGTSFSIGIAYTSVWYPQNRQGTALGIFGAGNAGAGITTFLGPLLVNYFTANGTNLEGWRSIPICYGVTLLIVGIIIFLFCENKLPSKKSNIINMLKTLKIMRVWRLGFYYFLVFGCFVGFSQWLIPYYVNVYYLNLTMAGFFTSFFSFPSGAIRILGGWLSDVYGARRTLYWVFISSCILSLMITIPKMEIYSPGRGISSKTPGVVSFVSDSIIKVVGKFDKETEYVLIKKPTDSYNANNADVKFLFFPVKEIWQDSIVKVGQRVAKNELLAKGTTKIFFQANVYVFTFIVSLLGIIWGIGKSAVYKHIPYYFPNEVGAVGGMVGALGGLGGFFGQVIFGYLLVFTGLWTSCWAFMFFLSVVCLWWMHIVVQNIIKGENS